MEKQDLKDSVLLNLRSVTQSCKGGVPFERLQRDYRDLLGTPIPFKELGYNSLEAFIRDIPDVISLKKSKDGQLVAVGVADESTAHIVSLVSRQKTEAKRVTRGYRRLPPHIAARRSVSTRFTPRPGSRFAFSHVNTNSLFQRNAEHNQKPKSPRESFSTSTSTRQYSKAQSPVKFEHGPSRKYEVAPRFRRLHERRKSGDTSVEEIEVPASSTASSSRSSSLKTNTDTIYKSPAPRLPNSAADSQRNIRTAQLKSLEAAVSAKEYVNIYAEMNKIDAVYRTMRMGQRSKGYVSSLALGDKTYPSYPEIKPTTEQAEEEAARVAMCAIKDSKENLDLFQVTPIRNAEEIKTLLSRIEQIVCEKPSGMFVNGIVREYENTYKETLPDCWVNLVKQNNNLDVDAIDVRYGKIPEGANFIIRPPKELSSGSITPSSTSSKTEFTFEDFEERTKKITFSSTTNPKISHIKIPDGNMWDVYVSNISGSLAARLHDYWEQFIRFGEEMKAFYKNRNFPVTEIIEKKLYAGNFENDQGSLWHRVIVDEIRENDEVSCYFVDEGEFSVMKKSDLQELSLQFMTLPYQAIQLSLEGVEEYENFVKYEYLEEYILGGNVKIAEVKRWWATPDFLPECPGIHRMVYSVVLYETSGEEDVNLNEFLKGTVLDSLVCSLPELSHSSCAHLSHVTPEGQIFLRLTHPRDCWLEYELERLSAIFEDACKMFVMPPVKSMCAAKFEDGQWRRAIITKHLNSTLAEVFFIDYGSSGVVGIADICELESISELLASVPYQAICCELFEALPSPDTQWTEAAIQKLIELAPFEEELMIRVLREGDDTSLAKVNLYKRNNDSYIITINHTLACSPELFQKQSSLEISSASKVPSLPLYGLKECKPKNSLSSFIPDVAVPAEEHMARKMVGSVSASDHIDWVLTPDIKSPDAFEVIPPVSLKLPEIPDEGKFFDVYVTLAANPCNFIVQPFSSRDKMDELIKRMQQFYSSEENFCEMHLSLLKENHYYAAMHSDGLWYRIQLTKVVPGDPVTAAVYYVDFGDFNTVNMSELQPLFQEFSHLPCQAISASLAGVNPIDMDWDPVHCINFKGMVNEKAFVSVVEKKNKDPTGFANLKLELTLIDVSDPNKDVYIHKLLIEKGIAKAK